MERVLGIGIDAEGVKLCRLDLQRRKVNQEELNDSCIQRATN